MAKPKLALVPAAQGSKFYSVLPSDGVGDFDFARASAATRINKYGLIETVASGQSRLNYPLIDGVVKGCPSHLLEPQRTNLVTNSSEFTGGLIGVSVLRDVEPSPDGNVSADKLLDNSASGEHLINSNITLNMVSGTSYTCSAFFKSDGTGGQGVIRYYNGSTFHYGVFNLENGNVSYNSSGTSKIEKYPNGWYRCSISFTSTGTYPNPPLQIGVGNALNQFAYQGASNLSHYFWGVQAEQGSYETSYIPTSGSQVTRVAETANNSGDASTFNDSEGVLMAEISALADDGTIREIALSDGSTANRIEIRYSGGNVQGVVRFSANVLVFTYNINDTKDFIKASLKYKSGNYSFWVNGFETQVDTTTGTPTGLSELAFDDGNGNDDFYGNTKQIQYFDSALNDSELETLTSWTSFSEMATSQLYSIQ